MAATLASDTTGGEHVALANRCARESLTFPESALESVERCATELDLKLHEVLFCLFAEARCREQKRDNLVLGVPTAGRQRADVINLIGSFMTTLPCRLQAPASASFRIRLGSLGSQLRETLDHQNVTYADIVKNTPAERDMFPEFVEASLAFQDIRNRPTAIADLTLKQLDLPRLNTEYPIEFWIRIQPGGFIGVFDYNEASVDAETIHTLKNTFAELISDMENNMAEALAEPAMANAPVAKKPLWRKLFQ